MADNLVIDDIPQVKPKHPGGRPPKYKDRDELSVKVTNYFNHCQESGEIPDTEGLAVFLDVDRRTLIDWETNNKELSPIVKKAKTRLFASKKQLAMRGKMNPAVFIFDAKNNHEYVDKQETAQNVNAVIEIKLPKGFKED